MKKTTLLVIISLAAIAGVIFLFREKPAAAGEIVLYYGRECPHCANIDAFIQSNKLDEKITINRKEVYHDQGNALDMARAAKKCGLPGGQVGVPFLSDGASCHVGEDQVRDYLFQYVKQKNVAN
ncbi:hypothetical protein EPN28_04415 [Patescibacteria group bacterium]|nr:MAG: hypothetical protein EPN28_04415 [Patescibacteria group bacterium]